jgi:hypothetical protein
MSLDRLVVALLVTAVTACLVPVATAQVGPTQACTPQAAPAQLVQPARVCRSAADLNELLRSTYTAGAVAAVAPGAVAAQVVAPAAARSASTCTTRR